MIHHKLLEPSENQIFNFGPYYVKFVLRFEKTTTKYFESKCRFYYDINPIIFESTNGDEILFEDLINNDLIEFQITYNKNNKRIYGVSLYVKKKETKGKKYYQIINLT